jgi:hypothetical protein
VRLPPADVAANPARFPYADSFLIDGAPVAVADVRALLLPFIGGDRVARFDRVARTGRRFDVLPIVEGEGGGEGGREHAPRALSTPPPK